MNEENEMSLAQLEKLAKNPHYKMSDKQRAMLEKYRANQYKSNPSFAKHPTNLEQENAREHTEPTPTNND